MENDTNEDYAKALKEQAKIQESLAMLESIAKKKMTREAISRYGNLKIAHPQLALKAIMAIAQATSSGMQDMIDDDKFKEILREINKQK